VFACLTINFLKVENSLYKLHSSTLSGVSHTFKEMFGSREPGQRELDGLTMDKPIVLPQVTESIFDEFLAIIYGRFATTFDDSAQLTFIH
jgi:hypothetical protein